MTLSLVTINIANYDIEFKKVMVLLEKAGKEKDSRLASSLTK